MEEAAKTRIAIYSRKSKFTGKGESIENQIELCKQYIRTHFPNCAEEDIWIYEDEGFSGGNVERPRFKRMMADAKTKNMSAIVCYRLDRISRNIGDFAKLIEALDALHIAFISIKEQFDTASPMGRAMMYISSVFSQLERETIAERIRDNMQELSKTGRWLGGISPTGYASESVAHVSVNGKAKKAYRLKLIPAEAEIVKKIFQKFLEMNSLAKTETYFVQRGYKTKNGRVFTRFALKNILTNPVYMIADEDAYHYLIENEVNLYADSSAFDGVHGMMVYNRTIQKSGKTHEIRPLNEWIFAVGKHTGLINGSDWVKAQAFLYQNRSKAFRKPRSSRALLSGLLFCTHCGERMRSKASNRLDVHGAQVYSYLCVMKEKSRSHICNMKNASGNILDKMVCEEMKKLVENRPEFFRLLDLGKKQLIDNCEVYDEDLERLRAVLMENEQQIHSLVAALTKVPNTAAEAYIVNQISELHNNGESLKHRIEELEALAADRELSDEEFCSMRCMLGSFEHMFYDMGVEQKRAALRSLITKVVWDGENAHVYFLGSDDDHSVEPLCENSK